MDVNLGRPFTLCGSLSVGEVLLVFVWSAEPWVGCFFKVCQSRCGLTKLFGQLSLGSGMNVCGLVGSQFSPVSVVWTGWTLLALFWFAMRLQQLAHFFSEGGCPTVIV